VHRQPSYEELVERIRVLEEESARRIQTEEALRESEEKFRLITDSIDEVFWMADVEIGLMLYVSRSFERIWGRTPESLYKNPKSFLDAIHEDDRCRVMADYDLKKMGQPIEHEYRIIHPNGNIRHIWDRGFPVMNEKGEISGYAGIATDITERMLADKRLRESEEKYREVVELAGDGIFLLDSEGRFEVMNPKTCEMLGYAEEELRRISILDTYPDELRDVARDRLSSLQSGTSLRFERPMKRKDGKVFLIEATTTRTSDGRLLAIIHDITERKRTELALQESEAKYRALTEKMNDVIWTTDLNFQITYISPSITRLVGFTPEECMRMAPEEAIAPESLARATELLHEELFRDGSEGADPERMVTFEIEESHKNGSTVWVECSVKAFRDKDGKMIGLHGLSRDISERRRAAMEKEQLIAELNQALSQVKTLSGLLPICSFCKKIRDDRGYWNQLETFISQHSEALFSHSVCPECLKKHYPGVEEA
jgi:PAS domain S-box-containing protein